MPVKSRKYKRGLIVGKFSPLHLGHEHLVRRAREKCDEIYIFSYSNPEFIGCEANVRAAWLANLFPDITSFTPSNESMLTDFGLDMPRNEEPDLVQREFVAALWQRLVDKPLDVVFTSEEYGDGFADELSRLLVPLNCQKKVNHELVDLDRTEFPISGSMIREDLYAYRRQMSPPAYSSFIQKICFIGAESTGKSHLVRELATQLGTTFVHEYGRTLWEEQHGRLNYEDLLKIARRHVANEDEKILEADRYLFVDTSPLTTLIYCKAMFGMADDELYKLANRNYDRLFLCMPDFPFVQDGTRSDEAFRQFQHTRYLAELQERQMDFTELGGPFEQRIKTVLAVIGIR